MTEDTDDADYDLDDKPIDLQAQALHAAAIARELREMALSVDYYKYLSTVPPHHRDIWISAARLLETVIVGAALRRE